MNTDRAAGGCCLFLLGIARGARAALSSEPDGATWRGTSAGAEVSCQARASCCGALWPTNRDDHKGRWSPW